MNKSIIDNIANAARVARIALEFVPIIKRGVKALDRLPNSVSGEEKARLLSASLTGAIDGLEAEIAEINADAHTAG